ncbi:hypothetical protein D9Q98_004481 [Chlorella vulgaris]|uniref:BZIP domain-containing protein n=1 Tax=Chlorella vulgaris TaxID=3077 RepID=A0A9D4TPR8_CHLVU|nr:hypothetical protein D9Q98_004481 [Chlorella vulgaris]
MVGVASDLEGMPSLGFDDVDIEMMAAIPADAQYNEIMEKDVLQYFGLYGTAADTVAAPTENVPVLAPTPIANTLDAVPGSIAGSAGGSAGGSVGGSAGGSAPSSRGGSGIGAQMLLGGGSGVGAQMLFGGASGIGSQMLWAGASGVGSQLLLGGNGGAAPAVGSAAQHVEALLAGTHPSMRGGSLAEWLAADGPVVSLPMGAVSYQHYQAPATSSVGPQGAVGQMQQMQALQEQQLSRMHAQAQGQAQMQATQAQLREMQAANAAQQQQQHQLQHFQQQQQQHLQQQVLQQQQQQQQQLQQQQLQLQFQQAQRAQEAPMVLQLPGGMPMLHPAFFSAADSRLTQQMPSTGDWMDQQLQQQQQASAGFYGQQYQPTHTQQYQGAQQYQHVQQYQRAAPSVSLQQQMLDAQGGLLLEQQSEGGLHSPVVSTGGSGSLQSLQQVPSINLGRPQASVPEHLLPTMAAGELPLLPLPQPLSPTPPPMPVGPAGSASLSPPAVVGYAPAPAVSDEDVTDGSGMAGAATATATAAASEQQHRGTGTAPASNKRFSDRQKAKISNLEAELNKLQESMMQVKLENERLKSKNLEVEQQLRTQEQLQQLAAVAVTASAQQAQQALAEEAVAAADGRAPFKLPVPPLGAATGLSPPNSQRKLLAHLSLSMRPADREMRAVAALTWPKLQEWYCQLVVRLGEAVSQSAALSHQEADALAKEAFKHGRYWDLLVLISRPDLSSKLLHEDFSVGLPASSVAAAAAAAQAVTQQQQPLSAEGAASWAAAAVAALQLTAQQRQALAAVWSRHSEQAAQRAQRKQELLTAIRSGFLQPLQRAAPEDVELGKPLAAQGLEAMEALRLVVRQDHVSAVQIACGVRKLLSPMQQARLAAAAWPWYPYPSKWAPLLDGPRQD